MFTYMQSDNFMQNYHQQFIMQLATLAARLLATVPVDCRDDAVRNSVDLAFRIVEETEDEYERYVSGKSKHE